MVVAEERLHEAMAQTDAEAEHCWVAAHFHNQVGGEQGHRGRHGAM